MATLVAIASPFAMADEAGWYVGAGAGQSRANIDDERIIGTLLETGLTTTSITDDDRHFAYKVFGGYRFNRYIGLEGGYYDLGRFSFTADTLPPGTLSGRIKLKGVNFDGVGTLPFTEKLYALGRVGVGYTQARDSFAGSGAVNVLEPRRKKRAAGVKFGVGFGYDFIESFGMRVEAERYRVDDAVGNRGDIDLLSASFLYRFGAETADTRPASLPQPSVVVTAPVLVVVPAPTPTQQYCTILDIQFEIAQDDIQREETERLAVIGTFMRKYPDTTAVIEGHTDNVGTAEHNMTLSQRRADSVVSYLVNNLSIMPSRLTAAGYGDTRPVGDNRTEEGKRLNRRINALVACATDVEGLTVAPARMTMAMLIEFDRNAANVKPQYRDELRKVADFLKANPSVTATVEGHTANLQATPALAMEISRRRAQNVVSYLVDQFDVPRSRLTAEGFGQARRFAYNTSLEGRQENRRVNIIINYPR